MQRTTDSLGAQDDSKMHDRPANVVLPEDESGKKRAQSWNYHSAIDMMAHLAST